MKDDIIENVSLEFTHEFEIREGDKEGKWLKIGGTALTEGVSRNKNSYTIDNLRENDGRSFKWLVGHPEKPEDHVVGIGKLKLESDKLMHEGTIRNTANHPDVVEQVRDGFLGPSIHAKASKITRKNGEYHIEGLEVRGVGLVAFEGVKNASIDYAIAESFDQIDLKESSSDDEENKDKEADKMPEEKKPEVAPEEKKPETQAEKPAENEGKPEEDQIAEESAKRIEALEQEIAKMKDSKKIEIVESILSVNKDFKKDDLMKESEEKLEMIYEYEKKLSTKSEEGGIVEEETDRKSEIIEKDGTARLSEQAYNDFNKELRERV